MNTIISVLMSIYNESFHDIEESIESILSQTYPNFELIIVNDNPNRKEYIDLLNKYCEKDKRIIIIQNEENIGLAASMNKALAKAKGELIARMDADDISIAERFQKEADLLLNTDYDVVFSNYTRIGPDDEYIGKGEKACSLNSESDLVEQIVFNGVVHHPTVMMKKKALQRVNGYRLFPCSQDQDLWIRLLESGARFVFVDEILLLYRVRDNSISQKRQYQQYITIQYILHLMKERIIHSGKDSYSKDAYDHYIERKNKETHEKERFSVAIRNLDIAKEAGKDGNFGKYVLHRIMAFVESKTLRRAYIFKMLNKRKVVRYIHNIDNS